MRLLAAASLEPGDPRSTPSARLRAVVTTALGTGTILHASPHVALRAVASSASRDECPGPGGEYSDVPLCPIACAGANGLLGQTSIAVVSNDSSVARQVPVQCIDSRRIVPGAPSEAMALSHHLGGAIELRSGGVAPRDKEEDGLCVESSPKPPTFLSSEPSCD